MEEKIKQLLLELGFDEDLYDSEQENRVKDWLNWYKGKIKEHTYYVFNGQQKIKKIMKSLNIIPQACEDISDFFFNEKLDITIDNENLNNIMHDYLKQNNFLTNSNKLMQLVKALGTGAYVAYLEENVIRINYLNATNIVILESDKNEIKSVLFHSTRKTKQGVELYLNAHIDTEEGYVIENRKYIMKNKTITEIPLDENIRHIETKSFIPRFAMLTNTPVNNLDIESPYGISQYANAKDVVISIDANYDSLDIEIVNGKKRLFVKPGATSFNVNTSTGQAIPFFDNTETTYYQLPNSNGEPDVIETNGTLRIDQITNALQSNINLFSSKMGLGHNYYKFKDGQVYVNTDNVMSSNSDVYRKIKKQENIITDAITNLLYAIADLTGITEQFNISINYDDSIIEDTEAIRVQAQTEYNTKLISKAQYYRDVYKLSDESAIQFAQQMNEEIKAETIFDGEEMDLGE